MVHKVVANSCANSVGDVLTKCLPGASRCRASDIGLGRIVAPTGKQLAKVR